MSSSYLLQCPHSSQSTENKEQFSPKQNISTQNTIENEIMNSELDINEACSIINEALMEIINNNTNPNLKSLIKFQNSLQTFYSPLSPIISLEEYLKRIVKFTSLEVSTLLIAIAYIDQFCSRTNYLLTKNNIFR